MHFSGWTTFTSFFLTSKTPLGQKLRQRPQFLHNDLLIIGLKFIFNPTLNELEDRMNYRVNFTAHFLRSQ